MSLLLPFFLLLNITKRIEKKKEQTIEGRVSLFGANVTWHALNSVENYKIRDPTLTINMNVLPKVYYIVKWRYITIFLSDTWYLYENSIRFKFVFHIKGSNATLKKEEANSHPTRLEPKTYRLSTTSLLNLYIWSINLKNKLNLWEVI